MTLDSILAAKELNLKPNRYLVDVTTPYLYQKRAVLVMLLRPRMVLGDDVGLGKGHPISTNLLTPLGWKKLADLKVGDEVIGSNGEATKITAIYERGKLPVRRVTFNDGSSVRVDADHLWAVRTDNNQKRGQPFRAKSTSDLSADLTYPTHGQMKWRIPLVAPVRFKQPEEPYLPLDSYLMGVWLGDGSGDCILADDSSGILKQLEGLLPTGCELRKTSSKERTPAYGVRPEKRSNSRDSNPMTKALRELGLWGARSWEKFIPDQYLYSTPENRLSILQGLLDTDGEIRDDHASFSSASERLADQAAFLVRSLGGITHKSSRIPKCNGVEHRRTFKITVILPEGTRGTRAKAWMLRTKYRPNRLMESIEYDGREEVRCISVEAEDHLYVTEDFIVTHNTLESIYHFTYLKAANPKLKAVVFTEKSALIQWKREIERFTKNLTPILITAETHPDKNLRISAMRQFWGDILITTYSMAYNYSQYMLEGLGEGFVLYADEPNYFKNTTSLLHTRMFDFASHSSRSYGLTATVIENRLDEAFGIMRIVAPGTLPSLHEFHKEFCIRKKIKRGVIVTVGYRKLDEFRKRIQPSYFGRLQDDPEVLQSLPDVITKDIEVLMSECQSRKVVEAMDRIVQLSTGEIKQVDVLPALILSQQFTNAPELLGFDIKSAKTEALIEMLENSLSGERVIVFSKFRSMLDLLEKDLKAKKIDCVRITGKESTEQREESRSRFMSDGLHRCNLLLMTRAGLKAINLQKGGHLIFFDMPWSYGNYRQAVGRIKRTGSMHKTVGVYRMLGVLHPTVASLVGGEMTIDHYTRDTVMKKKVLFNAVTGDITDIESVSSDMMEIFAEIKAQYKK